MEVSSRLEHAPRTSSEASRDASTGQTELCLSDAISESLAFVNSQLEPLRMYRAYTDGFADYALDVTRDSGRAVCVDARNVDLLIILLLNKLARAKIRADPFAVFRALERLRENACRGKGIAFDGSPTRAMRDLYEVLCGDGELSWWTARRVSRRVDAYETHVAPITGQLSVASAREILPRDLSRR